ncbi:class I SAM-dependent methyltransferase [Thermodesulfobacteriota bacterium]
MDYNWDKVAGKLLDELGHELWREHSDSVNSNLLDTWLHMGSEQRILKTDLFDEAVSEGLFPVLAKNAKNIFGMDISDRILLEVKSSQPDIMSVKTDARNLPFSDNVFDYVVSNSTLDHFVSDSELVAALCELRRVLRPGGRLILTLDNLANPVIALRRLLPFKFLRRLGILPYYVGITYTPWRLRRVLDRIGMDVVEITAIMHFPRFLVVALGKLIDKRGGERIRRRFFNTIMAFESLSRLPSGYFTGYFVAARAQKMSS